MKFYIQHLKHEISEEEALNYLNVKRRRMEKDGDVYRIPLSPRVTLEVICENNSEHNKLLNHMNIRPIYEEE